MVWGGQDVALGKADFMKRVPLFEGLDDSHTQALADLAVQREYARGSAIFFEGDPGDALYLVQSGLVKIYRIAEDGREKTLALLGEGEFFGEMALFDDEPRSAIAQALEKTTLLILFRNDFLDFLGDNPAACRQMIKVLSHRLRETNAQVMDIVFRDVRSRLARTLLELSERHGVRCPLGVKIEVKLTHQELANLVGTARETVTRILAEMQDNGSLTIDGRYLVLRNPDMLVEFAYT